MNEIYIAGLSTEDYYTVNFAGFTRKEDAIIYQENLIDVDDILTVYVDNPDIMQQVENIKNLMLKKVFVYEVNFTNTAYKKQLEHSYRRLDDCTNSTLITKSNFTEPKYSYTLFLLSSPENIDTKAIEIRQKLISMGAFANDKLQDASDRRKIRAMLDNNSRLHEFIKQLALEDK